MHSNVNSVVGEPMSEPFCVRHVVYHLCSAELWQQVFEVVSGVKWLLARAQLEPLGLVLDLEHAAKFPDRNPHHQTVKLMGQALRMDIDELRHDYRSVPSQLVGRLIGYESREVQGLLAKLREWEGPLPQGW